MGHSSACSLYGIGAAKTGTLSVASMFGDPVRSAHEPEPGRLLATILDRHDGLISSREVRSYVRDRDRRLGLQVDISQLNIFILDDLREEFPQARFVLTVRDCLSWLDSLINHSLSRPVSPQWLRLRDLRFGGGRFVHPPQEGALEARGLYTLDGYLSYWSWHNARALEAVPPDRLLVVRTDEIAARAPEVAEFAGLPQSVVVASRTHENRAVQSHNVLDRIDPGHLESKVHEHCGQLMARYFPAINSLDDALKR